MSAQSNATINTVLSGKTSIVSTASKRERSSKSKRGTLLLGDDGFVTAFNLICQEMGIEEIPFVKILITEPIPWVVSAVQTSGEDKKYKSQSVSPISRATQSEKSKSMFPSTASFAQTQSNKTCLHKTGISSSKDIGKSTKIQILAVYNTIDTASLNMLIYKNFQMEDDIMGALQKSVLKFPTLKVLKLEFCNLTSDQLKAVKFLLHKVEGITELSLDGNPIPYQNFYILLRDTKLLYLSLKFCKINDRGVSKIADYITYPSAPTLFALNLSNNFITDNGCKFIAAALRTNRSLTYLSLADNHIGDVGCIYIIRILQKFALTHEEVLFRRKCNMEYLLRRKIAITRKKAKLRETFSARTIDISKTDKRFSKSTTRVKKDKASISSTSSVKKRRLKSSISEPEIKVEGVPKDPHPYTHECTAENKQIYCKGNFKLYYLNVAYNNITCKGLTVIKDMLKYQYVMKGISYGVTGISKLILEGNRIDNCQDLGIVMDMLSGRGSALASARHSIIDKTSRKLRSQ